LVERLARVDLVRRGSPDHRLVGVDVRQDLGEFVGTPAERVVGPGRETLDHHFPRRT
jgi:hypothetical protein